MRVAQLSELKPTAKNPDESDEEKGSHALSVKMTGRLPAKNASRAAQLNKNPRKLRLSGD